MSARSKAYIEKKSHRGHISACFDKKCWKEHSVGINESLATQEAIR